MLLIRQRAYARAGLVGNPSDGYHGKTISLIVRNFYAEVVLYEWEDMELVWSQEDQSRFRSVRDLVTDVRLHGYYGGIRLVKATIKRFVDYCDRQGHTLHDRNFSIRYQSNVPRGVGLAGSSAIIVATLRCLMQFYNVSIPPEVQPSLVMTVETEELGIAAGLQDRVIQVHEGLVYMNFAREQMRELHGYLCGTYERLDPSLLPPLFIAYPADVQHPSEWIETSNVAHGDLKTRFSRGDPGVVQAMTQFADLVAQAREALLAGDAEQLATIVNENFDVRRTIYQDMLQGQIEMVERARQAGASAKFAGSGGAIIGTYTDEAMFQGLQSHLSDLGCVVLKPVLSDD